MKQQGFHAEQVLAGSRITESELRHPHTYIELWQTRQVLANMRRLTGSEALGFTLAEEVSFSDFGIVGYALMSSRNMRELVNLWIAYSNSLMGELITLSLTENENYWQVDYSEVIPLGDLLPVCIEETLGYGHFMSISLFDQAFELEQLKLCYQKPTYYELYRERYGDVIEFDAGENSVRVRSPSLNAETEIHDIEFHAVVNRHCQNLLTSLDKHQPLASKIRNLLIRHKGPFPSLAELASALKISVKTIARNLKQEGLSYQQLLREFRTDLALEYLMNSELNTQEIASLLGYQEAKSFARAFRQWTGKTIEEYRVSENDFVLELNH
jgi:AraC-like DNA-binding protein